MGVFWFLGAALWIGVIATTIRPKVAEAVRRDHVTADEGRRFLWGLSIAIGFVCSAQGVIALIADQPIFCIEPFSFRTWPTAASTGLTLITWSVLLGWVWFGSGADLLGRIAPAFTNAPRWRRRYSPRAVRVIVSLLLAAAAVGGLVTGRTAPADRSIGCATRG